MKRMSLLVLSLILLAAPQMVAAQITGEDVEPVERIRFDQEKALANMRELEERMYRLANLIKFSFMKNIAFGFIMLYYQIFCAFSGQSLFDSVSNMTYNVIFSSLPILFFALLDRPVRSFATLEACPEVYNTTRSLQGKVFAPMRTRHWLQLVNTRSVPSRRAK